MNKERKLKQKIDSLESELDKVKRSKLWTCPLCLKRTAVSKLKLETEKFYVPPHGCTEGAYWTEGTIPIFNIKCIKCEKISRLINHLQYKTIHPDINLLNKKDQIGQRAWQIANDYRRYFTND